VATNNPFNSPFSKTIQVILKKNKIKTSRNNQKPVFLSVKLACGPMPNVMAALPNTGGAFCSMPQRMAHAHY